MLAHTGMGVIDEIKTLMKSGDAAEAEALCRKALELVPDDARLSLYLATCRRLQGDEAEFRRIMLDIAPKMEALLQEDPDCDAARLWRKSGAVLMEYVVLGVLVVAAIVGGIIVVGKGIRKQFEAMLNARATYGPAPNVVRVIESQPTNGVASATGETVADTNALETVSDSSRARNP